MSGLRLTTTSTPLSRMLAATLVQGLWIAGSRVQNGWPKALACSEARTD